MKNGQDSNRLNQRRPTPSAFDLALCSKASAQFRISPSPSRSFGPIQCREVRDWRFLSPGQGERWISPKGRDGEGVVSFVGTVEFADGLEGTELG
jgi:hypothetical protein